MKETIIFSGIKQFALLRLLAQYGVDTVGYRVFNDRTILSYIQELTGNLSSKKMIDSKEKACLYNKFLEEDHSYFKGASFEDAKYLSETIDSVRMLVAEDEEKEFEDKLNNSQLFKEKYQAIYKFYKTYINYLEKNNRTDIINEAREIIKNKLKLDKDIIIIKGEEISPLNRKLLEICFSSVKEIEYRDLFKVKKADVCFEHLYKSNGYTHEVANVFKIIAENKLPLDKCTIAYTNYNNFYNSIKEYSSILSLPVTFIDGFPSTEYNAYRFLYLITKLDDGLYGYDVLMNLIKDKSFNNEKLLQDINNPNKVNDFYKQIGDLKFSFNKEYNDKVFANYIKNNSDYKNEIKLFKEIFNKGIINLMKEYLIIDDASVSDILIKELELYRSISDKDDFSYFKSVLNTTINGSNAKQGTISACSINKVKENIRENMFFIGNDNDSFHISLAENSYISDEKLVEFNKDYAKTSIKNATRKIEQYKDTIQLAFDLKSNVYVSYSVKDEKELKNHNFISLLFDLQKTTKPNLLFEEFKNSFDPTNSYYGNNLRTDEKIIESYLNKKNNIINEEVEQEKEKHIDNLIDNHYSPTKIEQALKCRKKFFIENILKINSEDDYDVFNKFNNTDLGNMFHETMKLANEKKSKNEVLKFADEIFDTYSAKRNPLLEYELEKEKKEFLTFVERGFEFLKTKQQGIAEKNIETDLKINDKILHFVGTPDLVSGKEVIDYKAKRKITHEEEDELSCIQALIYALVYSDLGIERVLYYYPLFKKSIITTYNEKNIINRLDGFLESLINNDFKPAFEIEENTKDKLDDICKYCKFDDICGRKK